MDSDQPPPLEDLSEELRRRGVAIKEPSQKTSEETSIGAEVKTKSVAPQTMCNAPKQKTFGGFSKGFLSSTGNSSKKCSASPKKEDITFIKKSSDNNNLRLKEVQEAMKDSSKEWITDDLLNKIGKNKQLSSKFNHPKYEKVLEAFQKNPEQAMRLYAGDPEVQLFFKEWMGLLGTHFSSLGQPGSVLPATKDDLIIEPHNAVNAQDHGELTEILSKPEVRQAFQQPLIKELIEKLRSDPNGAQKLLFDNKTNSEFQQHCRTLIENGLLAIQSA